MLEKKLNIEHVDVEDPKIKKRNLWYYPLGTVGRDMIYTMVTSFLYLYVLYTKELTDAQIVAITMFFITGSRWWLYIELILLLLWLEKTK